MNFYEMFKISDLINELMQVNYFIIFYHTNLIPKLIIKTTNKCLRFNFLFKSSNHFNK